MLKKVRIKFIIVAVMISFLVLLSVSVGMTTSMALNSRRSVYAALDKYAQFACHSPEDIKDSRMFVVCCDKNRIPLNGEWYYDGTHYFTDENQFFDMVKKILDRKDSKGKIGSVYYIWVENIAEERATLIGGEFSREKGSLAENIVLTVMLNLCGLFLVGIIAWAASFWVIKPAEDALLKQEQFIADASHELKTPLAIISTNMEVLTADSGKSEWSENIESQTKRMSELIGELLDLAKIDEVESKPTLSEFDIGQTVSTAVLQFEVSAYENGKRIEVISDSKQKYFGNAEDVKKVASILTNNAVKYATNGTTIMIKLVKIKDKYTLTVFNEGCQIDEKDKDKLFERFYRTDTSRDRQTGGNGLGLAIAKALCERNKWKISVECEKNSYMKFIVQF